MSAWNEDTALRGAWRRVFSRSPIVREVLNAGKRYVPKYNKDGNRSKTDSVEFHCQVCDNWVKASLNKKKNIAVDHIIPVISTSDVSGKVLDWNLFRDRLFCDKGNLQRICRSCHNSKTQAERRARQAISDNIYLDNLEHQIKNTLLIAVPAGKILLRELSRFTKKTKVAQVIERAFGLKDTIKQKLPRES